MAKPDDKQDAKVLKGMKPGEKKAFKKEDAKMDKKKPFRKEDEKLDKALAKKVKKK